MTPLKAIKLKCLDCCMGQRNEVKLCPVTDCPLYPFRRGHKPKGNGSLSENSSIKQAISDTENMMEDLYQETINVSETIGFPIKKDRTSAATLKRSESEKIDLQVNTFSLPFYHNQGDVENE